MRGVMLNWRVVIVSFVVLGLGWACAAEPQPLPWPEQLERLQARARWEDPEALLHLCIVSTPFSYSETFIVDTDQSLTLACRFARPDGSIFELEYDDLRVRRTMGLTSVRAEGGWASSAYMQALQQSQGALQIGPREAIAAAQPHSEQFQEEVGPIASSSVILFLGEWSEERTGLPAMWSVGHYSFSKETEYIRVSALDGTIVERTTVVEEDD